MFSSDTSSYGMGSQTPIHPSRTPLHPYMTPMRDAGGWFFETFEVTYFRILVSYLIEVPILMLFGP